MLLTGNDHTIRGNHFHGLVYGGADAGAIYSGRDWTYRGQMIEHNLFENISKPWPVTQYCSSSVVVVVVVAAHRRTAEVLYYYYYYDDDYGILLLLLRRRRRR